MRTFPRFVVRGALPAALVTLVALAACGGEPAVQTEVVAEFRREENAQHVKRLVRNYGYELELQKRSDQYALRAPIRIARELRPGLEGLLYILALNDDEMPTEPANGLTDSRRESERLKAKEVLEDALHLTLRTHEIEFLSARVILSQKAVEGSRETLYEHVEAIVLLPATSESKRDYCESLAKQSLNAGIKTKAGSAKVSVLPVDVRKYLPALPPQPAQAAPTAPTEPPLPAEPSAPPPVADANVAPKPTASAAEPVAATDPMPMPNVEPAPVAAAAAVSPAPTPMPCPATPAAETTCPSPSGERQAASPTVPGSEPTVTPTAEPAADATAAKAADVPNHAAEAADPAPTETPDAPPRRGALWALYFVAIASLCGNVAFVLHWWRARRRENERARLARLFAKVA